MKKFFVLFSVLMLGLAVSVSAQDNRRDPRQSTRSTNVQSPRETHNVNNNTQINSQRVTSAPKQQGSSNQQSPRTTSNNSSNNNDRVQRDATNNSKTAKPKN